MYEFPTRAADYEIPTNSKSYDDDQLPEHPAEENLYVFVDGQPQEGRISIYADPDTQQLYNHDAYEQGPMKNHNWKYDTWGVSNHVRVCMLYDTDFIQVTCMLLVGVGGREV